MLRLLFTLVFILFWKAQIGQKITIDTLIIPQIHENPFKQKGQLKFPMFKTGNAAVDQKMNTDLKRRLTKNAFPYLSTFWTLVFWVHPNIYMDFEVTYVKNGIISFAIHQEGCGAYCTAFTEHYTYNYLTGNLLTIHQIIDTKGHFKSVVYADKDKIIKQHVKELKKRLMEEGTNFNQGEYETILEFCQFCDDSFEISEFSLHNDHFRLFSSCAFPNAIKDLEPKIVLKYKYANWKSHLKINLI